MLLLTLVAGHAADRYDRRRVLQICQFCAGLVAIFLAVGSFAGWLTVPEIFAAIVLVGIFDAFESPVKGALLPAVTPEGALQKGAALASGAMQIASIGAPALGGFIYAIAPGAPYSVAAVLWLLATLANGAIKLERPIMTRASAPLEGLFDGVKFVRDNPAILGTISLDLFTVLFGGATALLPVYAHDILHTGPLGLGMLRAAPGDRRAAYGRLSDTASSETARRDADAPGGHRLRSGNDRLRAITFDVAFHGCARGGRRGPIR